jgi:pentapeptide MXKDX repeat protein
MPRLDADGCRRRRASRRTAVVTQSCAGCCVTSTLCRAKCFRRQCLPASFEPRNLAKEALMTLSKHIVLIASAFAVSLSLLLAPGSLAQGKKDMGKDDMMKKDETMKKEEMKKDAMGKGGTKKDDMMMKKDEMKK